jgi:hypothetical protein
MIRAVDLTTDGKVSSSTSAGAVIVEARGMTRILGQSVLPASFL